MNFRSEQFRSQEDRQREAALCARYGNVGLKAVQAASAIKKPEEMPGTDKAINRD